MQKKVDRSASDACSAWREAALLLQIAAMALLVLSIIGISRSADSLEILRLTGPEGAFLLVFLGFFVFRKSAGLLRNLPLLLPLMGAVGIVYQSVFASSVIAWLMLSAYAVAVVLLVFELLLARLAGEKTFWCLIFVNTFALLWLYFDSMIFSVGRSHLSINHLVQLMHVAEEVKAALLTFDKGQLAVFFELLILVVAPVPAARLLMAGIFRVPKSIRASVVVLFVALLVFLANFLRFDLVCSRLSVFEYLPLRLDLGMMPVPDHPAFSKASELKGLLQQKITLDENKLYPEGKLAAGASFKPVNLVMISVESLRAHEFRTMMPLTQAFARRGLWLSNHFSVSNITFSSLHSIFRSSFPVNLPYTGKWLTEIPLQKMLESVGYSSLLIKPERINMPGTNFWGSKTIEVRAEPKWKNTPKVLEQLYEALKKTGRKAIHAYLYNLHYNYYYPPEAEKYSPVIPEDINLFLMDPNGENLAGLANRYANAALYTDQMLSSFLKQVEAEGRFADTLFVIFGDHGESLGEAGFIAHATGSHIKQFATPAFFVGAGVEARKIEEPTTHADLLPYICDLMGIESTSFADGSFSQEKSYPILHLDESVSGRLIVRHRDYMSIFDLTDRGRLKWLATVSNEFAIDDSVARLYTSKNFVELASVIKADTEFIKKRIGNDAGLN